MLRTTIQTTDKEGKELSIPPELRARVDRAAKLLNELLRGVGAKFNIDVNWRFGQASGHGITLLLELVAPQGGLAGVATVTCPFPKEALGTDESIRRHLWAPIKALTDILSEEVDREFERLRNNLDALVTTAEE
jgi:hypothetical protein